METTTIIFLVLSGLFALAVLMDVIKKNGPHKTNRTRALSAGAKWGMFSMILAIPLLPYAFPVCGLIGMVCFCILYEIKRSDSRPTVT